MNPMTPQCANFDICKRIYQGLKETYNTLEDQLMKVDSDLAKIQTAERTLVYQVHVAFVEARMRNTTLTTIEQGSDVDLCEICLDSYPVGTTLKCLPCKHKFHDECISKWLELKSTCPKCRSKTHHVHLRSFSPVPW